MPEHVRILHLSDTHSFGDDARHYGVVDTRAQLVRVLEAAAVSGPVDLVVCSGDVSEDGSEESYRRVHALLTEWAEPRGARVIYAMGNHDRRAPFRAVLGSGQPAVEVREPAGDDPERPVVSVAEVDGLRTIVLDSSVPSRGYGFIDEEQRAFLAEVLSTPAPRGTVVVVHHPPVRAQTDLLQALALQHPDALLDTVRGTDVRAVLSGHYHYPLVQLVRGVPVIITPGVANLSRSAEDPAEESASTAAGGTLLDLDDDGFRAVPFITPADDVEVFRFGRDRVEEIVALAGPPAAEATPAPAVSPAAPAFDRDYWEKHWDAASPAAGEANPYVVRETATLLPGTALDAGCGDGAEAVWLSSNGWRVTGADISQTALAQAAERAAETPVDWVQADLTTWEPESRFDLVVTSYAHPAIGQLDFYERVAEWVDPGGTLLIIGHLHPAAGSGDPHVHEHPSESTVTVADITARLDASRWAIETAEQSVREVVTPDGGTIELADAVVRARRLS